MAEVPRQSLNNRDNTSRSTQARAWCVLICVILFTCVTMIAPVVIVCITKNPYVLISIIPLGAGGIRMGNIWERIVNAHFELNDKDYNLLIEEVKANRSNGERQEHKDKNSAISNRNRSRFHEAVYFLFRLLGIYKKRPKWP